MCIASGDIEEGGSVSRDSMMRSMLWRRWRSVASTPPATYKT